MILFMCVCSCICTEGICWYAFLMSRHTHNTRLTPEKPKHGGPRQGAGRPVGKENVNLNVTDTISVARQYRHTEDKQKEEYQQQQDELVNPKGRSWSYHECTLILTLILAVIVHYGQTPTDALHTVSALTRRSYYCVHALWVKWRDEKEVYVVDTGNRGGGASCHVNHSHHVSVDVILTIIDYNHGQKSLPVEKYRIKIHQHWAFLLFSSTNHLMHEVTQYRHAS